jgi:acetate kinase
MSGHILTINAGSSSIKLGLFGVGPGGPTQQVKGVADLRESPARLALNDGTGCRELPLGEPDDVEAVLDAALEVVEGLTGAAGLAAVAHRVVHGGERFSGAVVIDAAAMAAIEALTPYAPLHQPQALRIIRAVQGLRPDLRQTASFDTAFHRTIPARNRRFALPRALHDQGLRRYGFHGLSYKSVAATLRCEHPELAAGRVVAAHLGSGASLCAMANGASRDTSMGFSTLDGVPMATRCGALDPGVLLHLLGPGGRSLAEVEDMLYHRSGLLGVSGISADSRTLLASPLPDADEALDLFTFRVAGEIARLAVSIGGLDGLVFTAGIGEHQPEVRARVASHLEWLALTLDDALNLGNARTISASSSNVACLVIPTDEEHTLAAEAAEVLELDRK